MLEQGIQANFPESRLKATGCHFFALAKWAEVVHGAKFSNGILLAIFETALDQKIMDEKCNVLKAPDLLNIMIGKVQYGVYHRDLKERPDSGNTFIVRLVRKDGTHFLCEHKGMTFDPMPPNRPAASTWSFDSYRYLT